MIKRYDFTADHAYAEAVECEFGDFVDFSDYEKLAAASQEALSFVDICASGGVGNTDPAFEREARVVADGIRKILGEQS
jgi:hypothetical protein